MLPLLLYHFVIIFFVTTLLYYHTIVWLYYYNITAARAVDRELLYIEWENFFPPTATTAATATATTTNNNNNKQEQQQMMMMMMMNSFSSLSLSLCLSLLFSFLSLSLSLSLFLVPYLCLPLYITLNLSIVWKRRMAQAIVEWLKVYNLMGVSSHLVSWGYAAQNCTDCTGTWGQVWIGYH